MLPCAAGVLDWLLRLLQPSLVTLLHSRIRSAAASLPALPLSTALLVAMTEIRT